MGFLKCPRSSWASKLDAHPLVFFCWAFVYSSSASVAWQSLLLMLTSIDGHLHSPLIILVDVRLSLFFCLLHTIPIIIFYSTHSAISMAHAHVLREGWKSLRLLKYETIAWLVIGVVHDESILVWRKWSMTKLYDFVGMNFLWPCYFEKT